MKKIILLIAITITGLFYSQIKFGGVSSINNSISIEFGSENKGLILPYTTNATNITTPIQGSIIYDSTDKKVKYFNGTIWIDLSIDNSGSVDLSLQDSLDESNTAKVAIGNNTGTNGILVLEENNKAMVLPKVNSPHLNIINPSAGMIVYDTVKKQLTVFNGSVWTFWKAPAS